MTTYKSSILLLLAIIGVCSAAVNYTEIPPAQYSKYTLIPSLRTIGINQVLSKAIKDGKIQNNQFSLVSNNHIYRSVNGTYSYYKYDLSLKNAKNDQLDTIFEVRYDNNTKKTLILATQYSVKYAPTNTTGTGNTNNTNTTAVKYTEIPPAQYSKYTLIPSLRTIGINQVLSNAVKDGKIQNNQFSLASNNHIYRSVNGTYSYYKYDLSLKNAKNDQLDTIFEVRYDNNTKKTLILATQYSVKYAPTNTTNTTGNNTGNPSTNQTAPGGYGLVPADQYNSTLISGLADFGATSIVNSGISKGKLPAGNYTVTSIESVYKQVLQNLTNYKYVVVITKSDATRVVDANYTIAYNPSAGNQSVAASGYSVRPWSV